MNKEAIVKQLIELEHDTIETAEMTYSDFVTANLLKLDEVFDADDQSHARQSTELSDKLDHQVHEHQDHLKLLEKIDWSPKTVVGPGAIVKVNDRYMIVAVAKSKFKVDGEFYMGISSEAPIYQCLHGKKAGDTCDFNNINFTIQEVF